LDGVQICKRVRLAAAADDLSRENPMLRFSSLARHGCHELSAKPPLKAFCLSRIIYLIFSSLASRSLECVRLINAEIAALARVIYRHEAQALCFLAVASPLQKQILRWTFPQNMLLALPPSTMSETPRFHMLNSRY
jgi:hypothetical protein